MTQSEPIFQKALKSENISGIHDVSDIFHGMGEHDKVAALATHVRRVLGISTTLGHEYTFGVDYSAIQAKLNEKGANPPLVVDGSWGTKSKAALVAYQKAHGLVADGIPGPITLGSLGLSDNTPVPATPVTQPPSSILPPGEVPNKLTPLTAAQAAHALSDGYLLVTGKRPSAVILALLLGQSALETGNWNSIHNYNFGNKKATSGDHNWQFFRCSEIVNGVEVFYDPPAPECRFAAYGSAAEGAAAFIRLLQSRPHWWNGLQSGTVDGFIQGLTTAPKYFTADPTKYRNTLNGTVSKYTALASQYAATAAGILTSVLLAFIGIGAYIFRKKLGLV
jgi:peptidoglycan hydrolase-like protein with peptidoglycan-binding domain